jgi:hypothetical protein
LPRANCALSPTNPAGAMTPKILTASKNFNWTEGNPLLYLLH